MNEFKAGDLVYSPTEGMKVYQVVWRDNLTTYRIAVGTQTFTKHGMCIDNQKYPSIFHATKENQALLEALYKVKFDDPPLPDKEKVIEALKNANGKPVVCWVKSGNSDWYIRSIGSYVNNTFYSKDRTLHYTDVKPLSPDEFVLA